MYLKCPRYGKGECYMEDDQGQGVVLYWKREKMSWCGCKGEKEHTSKKLKRHNKEGENSIAQRDKGAAKQHMVRRTGKHSKRGG